MSDKEQFVQMLIRAKIVFKERTTRGKIQEVTLDNGRGAVAGFAFTQEGVLLAFDIDKDAY